MDYEDFDVMSDCPHGTALYEYCETCHGDNAKPIEPNPEEIIQRSRELKAKIEALELKDKNRKPRFEAAKAAMQGMIANTQLVTELSYFEIVKSSVEMADTLLKELDK